MEEQELELIRVTEVGEFIRHDSCERRFKLGFNNRAEAKRLPFAERLFNSLDPVLQRAGAEREIEWENSLENELGFHCLNGEPKANQLPWLEFAEALSQLTLGANAYAREVELAGIVEGFRVEGRIDFIVVTWRDNSPVIRLVECKASRKDRTYHRVQVALYEQLVKDCLVNEEIKIAGVRVQIDNVESVVARIDESTNIGQSIMELEPLDLNLIASDVRRLLDREGQLKRIVSTELDELIYKLDSKCDGCVFNVDCFPESARLRRLELIGLDPTDVRIMKAAGIVNIDQLAELDLEGVAAKAIKSAEGFSGGLDILAARARARTSTLPNGGETPDIYQVSQLPNRWESQLPSYDQNGISLVRIYLGVDYDYTENRIGALSAHVTSSECSLSTGFEQLGVRWQPRPDPYESIDGNNERPVQGQDVVRFKTSPWTGKFAEDSAREGELIQGFIFDLIEAIVTVAQSEFAPVHFYVWSRSEINHLVEGCTRGGSSLLAHVNQLLGCRESLEQLIFSSVGEEVTNRFALGWTSTGLTSTSSLRWFGETYHWRRTVGSQSVDLDRVFAQDIFDFKTDLHLAHDGQWSSNEGDGAARHKFEIRSRFYDSLPAPYWHAVWNTLPDPNGAGVNASLRNAINRYNEARAPGRLKAYLKARAHALRWVEERVKSKNDDIVKIPLNLSELAQFDLGVNSVSHSAINFLQLEQHIRVSQWVSMHLVAPASRVITGRTIPLVNLHAVANNKLECTISLDGYDIEAEELMSRSMLHEGSFARITFYSGNPSRAQTLGQLYRGGSTCVVDSIDWDNKQVSLSVLFMRSDSADQFRLRSNYYKSGETIDFATLDESPSDFVAHRVCSRLNTVNDAPLYSWFDPSRPRVPECSSIEEDQLANISGLLSNIQFDGQFTLSEDQKLAITDGLDSTIQLLQGPPGTGKTQTTAVAILIRALHELPVGSIVLAVGNTHTSVDNLLKRIVQVQGDVRSAATVAGLDVPPLTIAKVHSSTNEEQLEEPIFNWMAEACTSKISSKQKSSVVLLGGTISALLKMASKLETTATFRGGFLSDLLVVDEASMMVFPSFLALTSLLKREGKIMLAGDHRQLAPILAHDWEREDRPPVILYQPFVSAYDAILEITRDSKVAENSVRRSALEFTYRLPPTVRSLIATLYRRDDIELKGSLTEEAIEEPELLDEWADLWGGPGLFLVVHNERESKKNNLLEADIIKRVLASGQNTPPDSVAVITPHRAQRTLLKTELKEYREAASVIDTVERLQGDQKPTIVISATASDPVAISQSVEFILDLNRSNVAFSRVQQRLIVVCSESLLNHIAPEVENYESAILWKSLRAICGHHVSTISIGEHEAKVFKPSNEDVGQLSHGLVED